MISSGSLNDQNQLRAIETEYDGHRFRSRQEARFAVLLNALSIPYRYELEGYHIGNGSKYLPDFWLEETETFVEIKGKEPTLPEFRKAGRLAVLGTNPVLILWGEFRYPEFTQNSYSFFRDHLGVFHSKRGDALWFIGYKTMPRIFNDLFGALDQARQARFEHGETPQ